MTDPGSPLDQAARADGYTVINADPNVGGRYSALTAFGLVPSGLAGADISALLDDAEAVSDLLDQDDPANPGLRLGAAMGGTNPLRDKLLLVDDGTQIKGFGDWAEQLIAESTGKDGKGILPVVINDSDDVALYLDGTVVWLAADDAALADGDDLEESSEPASSGGESEVAVSGSLGASLLLWEVATAVAGRLLDINPFDQPDVESAKKAARALLDSGVGAADAPAATDGAVEIRALGQDGAWLGDAHTVSAALDALVAQLDPSHGYLAIMAYLDRLADADFADVTPHVSEELGRPVTFGWGPRFLHSTGQYHKGGPDTGVYLQVTAEPKEDLAIPGRDFTFGEFIASQAGGDASVLAAKGRPVLQLHLTDHDAGLQQVRDALTALGAGKAHS